MKNKLYKALVITFYVLSLFILLFCIKIRLTPHVYLETDIRLIILFISCLLIYINGYILTKKLNCTKKILKINLILYFIIYTITICTLTLFDEIFGRQGFVIIKWDKKLIDLYMKYSFNIVPFKTIKLFAIGYMKGIVNFRNFSVNIIGNLCAFMPYGLFLPLIFKSINKYYKFLLTMIIIVILIELLQFVTMSGSCDIDDLILNVLGASIIYFIVRIKCINKFIHKAFLYE
jgi:glycopeptide antibiotics resistance protein